jgi:hypothetical protein
VKPLDPKKNLADPPKPGQRVSLIQQIPHGVDHCWTHSVTGTVVQLSQKKTGAWYAHARDGTLWLDRIVIRKDDGELTECVLDSYSCIRVLGSQETSRFRRNSAKREPVAMATGGRESMMTTRGQASSDWDAVATVRHSQPSPRALDDWETDGGPARQSK